MDLNKGYLTLNSMWTSLELGSISITFIFLACSWVYTDPMRPLGSLIIPLLRRECLNSCFWLRGCSDAMYAVDSFKDLRGRRCCNPFCLFTRLKPRVKLWRLGSVVDKNLSCFSHNMHTYGWVWIFEYSLMKCPGLAACVTENEYI